MRIGIVIPGFSANESDWCIPVYLNLVRGLAIEHDVRVFPIRYPFTQTPYRVYNAAVFPAGGGSYTRGIARAQLLRRVYRLIQEQHRQRPFDMLHAIWADETGALVNWFGAQHGIPTVVSIAGGELVGFPDIRYGLQRGIFSRWMVHQALHKAGIIIAPSPYVYRLALSHLAPRFHAKVAIVPLGVDTALFRLPAKEERSTHFLHVASLNPVKNQAMLLHMMTRLPEATLEIVGDGVLRRELENLTDHLGIQGRVKFHGEAAHDELPRFYQRAKNLVITSRHEAFCMAAAEALACGVNVIGTAVGILPEIGNVAPVGDFEELVQIAATAPSRSPQENRTLATSAFTIQHTVNQLLTAYRQMT